MDNSSDIWIAIGAAVVVFVWFMLAEAIGKTSKRVRFYMVWGGLLTIVLMVVYALMSLPY